MSDTLTLNEYNHHAQEIIRLASIIMDNNANQMITLLAQTFSLAVDQILNEDNDEVAA